MASHARLTPKPRDPSAPPPAPVPPASAPPASSRPKRRLPPSLVHIGLGAACGLVATCGHAPARLWPLAGVALVGLFALQTGARPRHAAAGGAAFFAVFSLVHNSYVGLFGLPALLGLTAVMAAFGAVDGLLAGRWSRPGAPLPSMGAPLAWVLVEAATTRIPFGGFPWGLSAHALSGSPLRRLAPFGGPLLVGTALAGAAATVAWALRAPGPTRRRCVLATAGPLGVAAAVVLAGALPTGTHHAGTARVGLVQATTMDRDPTADEVGQRAILRAHLAETARLAPGLDLVTWGESSLDDDPRQDAELAQVLRQASRRLSAPLLVNGAVEVEGDPSHLTNTTFLYSADGVLADTYSKRHLVPFGEYVPVPRAWLSWVKELARVPRDFLPGQRSGVMRSGNLAFGDLICFESGDLGLARGQVSGGAQLLVVNTNNRSYSRSPLSAQHVEVDRMLAQSTGRTVLHAAVSGTSAVIGPDGEVVALAPLFEARSIVATVPLESGRTPYVVLGDWSAWMAVAAGLGLTVGSLRRRKGEAHADRG